MFSKIFTILIFLALTLIIASPAAAAKKRIRVTKAAKSGTFISFSQAKLNRPGNSVVVNFMNLDKAKSVSYELVYTTNGLEQGASGSITPTTATDSRTVYFGTCSHGVCTPHRNITGANLTVKATLNSGGIRTKLYRIRI